MEIVSKMAQISDNTNNQDDSVLPEPPVILLVDR
jgi:hypothetical protein